LKAAKTNGFDFDEYTSLGNILVRRGAITPKQLARAVKAQAGRLLGETVIEMGFCTPAEVEAALCEQEAHRLPQQNSDVFRVSEVLERAYASFAGEVDRLSEVGSKTSGRGVAHLKFSPED
jgi:hypothetical protein